MIKTHKFNRVNELTTHFSKGKHFIINTILTYKTSDGYNGSIVKIKEDVSKSRK